MIAKQIVEWVENKDRASYGEILPNDAIALVRLTQLNDFAKLVEEVVNKTGKTLQEVLRVLGGNAEVPKHYPYITNVIALIVKEYN